MARRGNMKQRSGWDSFTLLVAAGIVACSSSVEVAATSRSASASAVSGAGGSAVTAASGGAGGSYCGTRLPAIQSITAIPGMPKINDPVALSSIVSDPDSGPPCGVPPAFSYVWSIVGSPAGSKAKLDKPNASEPSFTPDVAGEYTVKLVVSDGDTPPHASPPKTITIAVSPCGGFAPEVQMIQSAPLLPQVKQVVQLSAFVSDQDVTTCMMLETFAYAWSIVGAPPGSSAMLNSATLAQPSLVPDVPGKYTVQLVVTDNHKDASGPAQHVFTVVP